MVALVLMDLAAAVVVHAPAAPAVRRVRAVRAQVAPELLLPGAAGLAQVEWMRSQASFRGEVTLVMMGALLIVARDDRKLRIEVGYGLEGVLTDASGTVVADGNYNLTFKLYEAATGGSAIWTETQTVAVSNGVFAAILGSVTPIAAHSPQPWTSASAHSTPLARPALPPSPGCSRPQRRAISSSHRSRRASSGP